MQYTSVVEGRRGSYSRPGFGLSASILGHVCILWSVSLIIVRSTLHWSSSWNRSSVARNRSWTWRFMSSRRRWNTISHCCCVYLPDIGVIPLEGVVICCETGTFLLRFVAKLLRCLVILSTVKGIAPWCLGGNLVFSVTGAWSRVDLLCCELLRCLLLLSTLNGFAPWCLGGNLVYLVTGVWPWVGLLCCVWFCTSIFPRFKEACRHLEELCGLLSDDECSVR